MGTGIELIIFSINNFSLLNQIIVHIRIKKWPLIQLLGDMILEINFTFQFLVQLFGLAGAPRHRLFDFFIGRRPTIIDFQIELLINLLLIFPNLIVIIVDFLVKKSLGMLSKDMHGLLELFAGFAWWRFAPLFNIAIISLYSGRKRFLGSWWVETFPTIQTFQKAPLLIRTHLRSTCLITHWRVSTKR